MPGIDGNRVITPLAFIEGKKFGDGLFHFRKSFPALTGNPEPRFPRPTGMNTIRFIENRKASHSVGEIERILLIRLAQIFHFENEIGASDLTPGHGNSFPLDFVARFAHPGGIDEPKWNSPQVHHFLDGVAGRSLPRTDNRALIAKQAIEKAGLSDIWFSVDDGANSLTENAPLICGGKETINGISLNLE